MLDQAEKVLLTDPPAISSDAARSVARRFVSGACHLKQLTSERDQNFRFEDDAGHCFVLKLANRSENRVVTEFQTEALRYLETSAPVLPVPRVVPSRAGESIETVSTDAGPVQARVLTFLGGVPLREVNCANIRFELGAQLAQLDYGLKGFKHAGSEHPILWDLQEASHLKAWTRHIEDDVVRSICTDHLQGFENSPGRTLAQLPRQVIYNDLNPSNVLVNQNGNQITGIIDFGDITVGPRIVDLAVAAAYQVDDAPDWFLGPAEVVSGYQSVSPLQPIELAVLPQLILTRLVSTLIITNWRAMRYPQNRDYILRNAHHAGRVLQHVAARQTSQLFE